MSFHLDILFWLWANPFWILLLNAACLAVSGEATNTNFIIFGLTRPGLEPTIYRTRGEHANHYTTDAVLTNSKLYNLQHDEVDTYMAEADDRLIDKMRCYQFYVYYIF